LRDGEGAVGAAGKAECVREAFLIEQRIEGVGRKRKKSNFRFSVSSLVCRSFAMQQRLPVIDVV
jgi:hypothetical protein